MAIDEFDVDDEKEYEYILEHLDDEYKATTTKEDVAYILDIVYDYYVKEGFIKEDEAENEDEDLVDIYEDEIFDYVCSIVEKDGKGKKFTEDLIQDILECDYDYCDETGIFVDDDEDE